MPRIRRHQRQATRALAPARRRVRRRTSLELTAEQQSYLVEQGFGPATPGVDFRDPEVRARFVAALRSSGVLRTDTVAPLARPESLQRAG